MIAEIPEPARSAGADQTDPSSPETTSRPTDADAHPRAGFLTLLIGSIGVVYGDIGTSPLYALREALTAAGATHHGVERADVLGILSLVLWALTVIVTLKYVVILLRADNDGEGGTLSLMALAQRAIGGGHPVIFLLGITGAALFFGDAMITPAISVLSAVEGVKLITPAFDPLILPTTIVIIVALFMAQSFGTAKVAGLFGPITLVWFVAMAVGGLQHLADDPGVVAALDPRWAVSFMLHNGKLALVALGAVFLSVTGAEALYADLGHFGRSPIRWAWMAIVFPALALNYMGQAALVLARPAALENPFFMLYPDWALAPIVALATAATIIASQAVITGAYSLTRQAIQLKLLPRMEIRHTSAAHSGQIYMPQVNTMLLVGVLFLVVLFGSSSRLATAYGIAVTGTMIVTACLAFIVVWRGWKWPIWLAAALMAPFLCIDLVFFGANALKIVEGGYAPLMIAAGVMIVMWTWARGTRLVHEKTHHEESPIVTLARQLGQRPPHRVRGTAVFLTADPDVAPPALMHSLKHYKVLHEKNVLLTVKFENVPRVDEARRVTMEQIDENFSRVRMRFGCMEEPNVPTALALCRKLGWKFDIMSTSFFLSRRVIRAAKARAMPLWQDKLFIALAQNAADSSAFFHIPTNRVVEIGTQISI